MYNIDKCQKVKIEQGAFYLGESTEERSVGYLELEPHSSLVLHNRLGGIENLVQVEGRCIMIIFDKEEGTNYKLKEGDKLKIEPEGVWHIHANPFNEHSLTYWNFEGDIREIIKSIRKGAE